MRPKPDVDCGPLNLGVLTRSLRLRGVASIHRLLRHPLAGSQLWIDSIPRKTLGTTWTSHQLMANIHTNIQTLAFTARVGLESPKTTHKEHANPNRKSRWPPGDFNPGSCSKENQCAPRAIQKVFLTIAWQMQWPTKKKKQFCLRLVCTIYAHAAHKITHLYIFNLY